MYRSDALGPAPSLIRHLKARKTKFVVALCALILTQPFLAEVNASEGPTFTVSGYEVEGENPLASDETQTLLEAFTGESRDVKTLQDAAKALEQAIHELGYTFVRVILPRQPLSGGQIKLQVVRFALDNIEVRGNEFFTAEQVLRSLPGLEPGASPNTRKLSRSLAVAKQHPARQQKVTFSASSKPGRIDAQVEVDDRDPVNIFTWINNTGSKKNGRYRSGLGYQNSNFLKRDHSTTITYTTSPTDTSKVEQYGAVYQVPLYKPGGQLSGFLAESSSDSGRVAEYFDISGRGSVLGAQYTQYFARNQGYAPRLNFSITDKDFDNNVSFEDTPIGVDVRSRPVALRYLGDLKKEGYSVEFYAEYLRNWSSGSNNTREAYEATRAGAEPGWDAVRYGAGFEKALKDNWALIGRFDGQYSNEPLIAGEQFGVGGSTTVRGFKGREITGDRGMQLTLEAWSPALGKTSARGVVFAGAGRVRLVQAQPDEIRSDSIASIGAGVNWNWQGRFNAQLDFGYVLNGVNEKREGGTRSGDERVHFNLSYKFK